MRRPNLLEKGRAFFPRACVAGAGAKYRVDVQVGDYEVFLELAAHRHDLAEGIENDARAVEDQLVLPADEIDVCHVDPVVGRAGGQHILAPANLAGVEGRRADVDDDLRPYRALHDRRPHRLPDVLAHVDAYTNAANHVHGALSSGFEVAFLVEYAIVGREHLVVNTGERAVVRYRGGVVEIGVGVHEPDNRRDAFRRLHDLTHPRPVVLDELVLEQQVFRRIARNGKLGKRDEVGPKIARAGHVVEDLRGVPVEVADRRIDLCKRDSEGSHVSELLPADSVSASAVRDGKVGQVAFLYISEVIGYASC